MRVYEILNESGQLYSAVLIHETTPQRAEQIRKIGFKMPRSGIFFNTQGLSYSGGGYGGAMVQAKISGPRSGILDLSDDDNLPEDLDEFADGEEIAKYAHENGYWAWTDGLQMAVLDLHNIQIL